MFRGSGNKGQHLLLQADDHAMEEGANRAAQHSSLNRTAQCRKKGLQTVSVDLSTATVLYGLLVTESFTGPTNRKHVEGW